MLLQAPERSRDRPLSKTLEEKSQILYNHIAFGNQTQSWKRSVKDKLETVAAVDNFLPGIAERLGDPNFTRGLATSEPELIRFMKEPKEHLIDTINALETPLRAGLMLIYVHQGALASEDFSDDACVTVAEMLDSPSGVRIAARTRIGARR